MTTGAPGGYRLLPGGADLEQHRLPQPLLQLPRLTDCHHDVKCIEAVKIAIKQIRTMTFGYESADRYRGAAELLTDYFGCFALNNGYRITVRRLRRGYQVTGSGVEDIVFSPIAFRLTDEPRAIEQSFDAHNTSPLAALETEPSISARAVSRVKSPGC